MQGAKGGRKMVGRWSATAGGSASRAGTLCDWLCVRDGEVHLPQSVLARFPQSWAPMLTSEPTFWLSSPPWKYLENVSIRIKLGIPPHLGFSPCCPHMGKQLESSGIYDPQRAPRVISFDQKIHPHSSLSTINYLLLLEHQPPRIQNCPI